MQTIRVADRGYIVLPARIRKRLGIKKGTRLLLREEDDQIILQPIGSFTERLAGLTKGAFGKNAAEIQSYLDEQRQDR